MSPRATSTLIKRRTVLQAFTALPAFALFSANTAPVAEQRPEEFVEVNGWILKRSELA